MAKPAAVNVLDFEIHILPQLADSYPVHIRLGDGGDFSGNLSVSDIVSWPFTGNLVQDGQHLFNILFADPRLRMAWDNAQGRTTQCRIRLWIDVPELHFLPWELLHDGNVWLSANARTPFSRYLTSEVPWGDSIVERPIQVLAIVSNPKNLAEYGLTPIDTLRECELLEQAFSEFSSRQVQLTFLDPPVTLANLEKTLHKGYHVLHFVSHGMYSQSQQQGALYLEDTEGDTQVITDNQVCAILRQQLCRPHLIYLAACQSATRSTVTALTGLGPKLVAAGVPVVVAMQDQISVRTAQQMTAIFYKDLLVHGAVDYALNAARNNLLAARCDDVAVPVLFMRLQDGQLWRDSGTDIMAQPIAAHRAALRERLSREAQERWGGMSVYIQEEGATLPIEASPYQQGRLGPRENLIQTLHAADRLLVLGEPGSGKTVALERLAWELCNNEQPIIPVLIRLFRYDGIPLSAWIMATLQQTGCLRLDNELALTAFLRDSPAHYVFLFDGLNEVSPDYRDRLVGELARWIDTYPQHSVILASRMQDEVWRLLRDKMTRTIVVQSISDDQVRAYLDAHLGVRGRALYWRLDLHLREMARRPLILWLIKEAGAAGETVPGNRGELYTRFVSRILGRDTKRRMDAKIEEQLKREALAELAYYLGQKQSLACSREEAVTAVAKRFGGAKARTLVDVCARHGLLVGEDVLWFAPHQTVQEHFAAVALRDRLHQEWQQRSAAQVWRGLRLWLTHSDKGVIGLAAKDWWMETFVQLAGLVDDPDRLTRDVAHVNPWLAWWFIEERQDISANTRKIVEERSVQILRAEDIQKQRRAVAALAQIHNDRVMKPLFEAAGNVDLEVSQIAVTALIEFEEAVKPLAAEALRSEDRQFWRAALRWLEARPNDPLWSQVRVEIYAAIWGIPVVYIPPGPFLMGSNKSRDPMARNDETPQHEVILPAYWIGKSPVTVEQFRAFVQDSGYQWEREEEQAEDRNPVVCVNWDDIQAYCQWLSQRTGRRVTLPTEAQWEKAARGTDGRLYPWGNGQPDEHICNFNRKVKSTTPVGKYSPRGDSPYGCVDMAGNVWEWVRDWYNADYYAHSPHNSPSGPERGQYRILRGGSFERKLQEIRCAVRYWFGNMTRRSYEHGFRICVAPPFSPDFEKSKNSR